ncbi:ribose-phosphate pyrophosphokinase [Clostridium acetobutylicum]|uniref:Ribose-phosphate pyrophosphokinase n=1 Tax=Clostridium acetobutylicum (strain ATCC 824 / DSM 792 / JCM 1419 / IAM 19013 / LMG 5710 / NBRC 13948 / NRRL B-527 / VKM B-1787 / 2291 / W) TaxID=272562 RepID=KPRS_CLOAB|nr:MULTISPECIES: ribose-phosphate pyrophosphokinase [Clostridium]Q97E93.1 RecName: Full=Ribose-phosphate pyrophosphokinase; Short=RPPK; AltName: Full=5-phospho-D-ribosyl alpha-1-diphosphate synthase; AltName: Full=Phosphoribosyl diphosphate synthase; AltName: Full=Phosphoribosyl pyrophosphate synthase; Short=P-Rib-PP synthase; Short=PRPP synthase; Short=PRPPase [Clostridium acetobutylicum ATCC 824]AAK81157.1 Phosphoribosylpyrophosphate synthetase [Clostridium acetobutylicum ATCC 824]ADZ22262.1 P
MINHGKNIKIFTGNSYPSLAEEIADIIGVQVGDSRVGKFSNGETAVDINETVRGTDLFLIQTLCEPVNDSIMELLIMLDAFKRASAGRITAVIPNYAYARQDRKAKARQPITAKLMADLIHTAGADRVLTMDLHAPQIQGFFDIPVDHLEGVPILAKYFINQNSNTDDLIVVSPDIGGVKRTRKFAEKLHAPIAIIDKRRPKPNVSEVMSIIGDVKGKKAILVDDMIDTAGSIVNAAEALVKMGAKEVSACCTHGVLSGPAIERLENSPLKEVVILNTIPIEGDKRIDKIKVLSVAPIFAEAIRRIYEDMPVSKIFQEE